MKLKAASMIVVMLGVRVLAVLSLLLLVGRSSYAGTICEPSGPGQICTHTRDVAIWFGTLSVVGAPGANVDIVQLTDTITGTLAGQIFNNPAEDARVRIGVGPWIDNTITDIDWVDAPSQNLPAQQNLSDAFAAAAASLNAAYGTGTLTILPAALGHGPLVYNIANWTTQNPVPGDGTVTVDNVGNANVTAFEQNAIWTASRTAAPALKPIMLGVVTVLLLLVALRNMRRRHG